MARTDYLDDPDAPAANSIVVACTAFVLDDQDRVLLISRSDNASGRCLEEAKNRARQWRRAWCGRPSRRQACTSR